MRRSLLSALAVAAGLALAGAAWADDPTPPTEGAPVDSGKVEKELVRLVLLDVVVLDGQSRTVPDLEASAFEVFAGGDPVEVDTLDVSCPGGAAGDARAARDPASRPPPAAPDMLRRIVLAFDYLHLSQVQRVEVLEQARRMIGEEAAHEELMVVALNGGLRVEQPFTRDRDAVRRSLKRMEYDISLWQPDFYHMHENAFVEPLVSLLDVLSNVEGPKAVVLYSAMGDVPLDLQFREIAAVAAASRCTLYPVDARGLVPPGALGSRAAASPG